MRAAHRLLRESTSEAHERLDALFMGFDLSTADGYRRFIGAQASALLPIEAALDAGGAEQVVADWPGRRRGSALLADAAELGITPEPVAATPYRDLPALAGALYVVEGSHHGARHLRKLVAPDQPAKFLNLEQVSGSWVNLLDRIDAILYEPAARSTAKAAALATFDCFERAGRNWMNH